MSSFFSHECFKKYVSYMCVCAWVNVCVPCVCLRMSAKGMSSPGTGAITVAPGNQTLILCRNSQHWSFPKLRRGNFYQAWIIINQYLKIFLFPLPCPLDFILEVQPRIIRRLGDSWPFCCNSVICASAWTLLTNQKHKLLFLIDFPSPMYKLL